MKKSIDNHDYINTKQLKQHINHIFDKDYLLQEKKDEIMKLMNRSIEKGFLFDNVNTNLKILLTFLKLNTVEEKEDSVMLEMPEAKIEPKMGTRDFFKLKKVWNEFYKNHEEICMDDKEYDSEEEDENYIDKSAKETAQEIYDRRVGQPKVEVIIENKNDVFELKVDKPDRKVKEREEEIFKSQFVLKDFLNNNRNVLNCQVIYDILSLLHNSIDNSLMVLDTEKELKESLNTKISNFNTVYLFNSLFRLIRKISRVTDFYESPLRNPVFVKFQSLIKQEVYKVRSEIVDFQYTLINQYDRDFDQDNYKDMQKKGKRTLTFFQLNKWMNDNEYYFDILQSLIDEINLVKMSGKLNRQYSWAD